MTEQATVQTVCTLTPIIYYRIDGGTAFTYSSEYKGAQFTVELRPYSGPTDHAEFTKNAHANIPELIRQLWNGLPNAGRHVLLIQGRVPTGNNQNVKQLAIEYLQSTLEALRLHSTAGLTQDEWLEFCDGQPGQVSFWMSRQLLEPLLPGPSTLKSTDFAACRQTAETLRRMSDKWTNITHHKVVGLAKEYHRLSFTLEKVEHAFLILMVAFEAMFKKDHKERIHQSAPRIGRLLGATQKECDGIQEEFKFLYAIRNNIAHGDPSLKQEIVDEGYPRLYSHMTAAIIKLLNLPSSELGDAAHYYDRLTKYTDNLYSKLPAR